MSPRISQQRTKTREIATLLVAFVVNGCKVAQSIIKKHISVMGVWYQVEVFVNEGPEFSCFLCCGSALIKTKHGSKPNCGYCSGHHQVSNYIWTVLGCMANQGSLCGHMQ